MTATADQGARQTIRRIARENPARAVVVTGCYATRRPEDVAALPGVVRVVRNDDKDVARRAIWLRSDDRRAIRRRRRRVRRRARARRRRAHRVHAARADRLRRALRLLHHPDDARRGTQRADRGACSREVERVAAAGFQEIALTGVHLGSYGRDLVPAASLLDLLRRARERAAATLLFRISSLEPMDCTPDVVDLVASSDGRFAPHFHLPLQHASDRMLARDAAAVHARRTTADSSTSIRRRMPHASIGSDIIVGFPGETDDDFEANLDVPAGVAADAPARVSRIPIVPAPRRRAMRDKVHGVVVRERGARAARDRRGAVAPLPRSRRSARCVPA